MKEAQNFTRFMVAMVVGSLVVRLALVAFFAG